LIVTIDRDAIKRNMEVAPRPMAVEREVDPMLKDHMSGSLAGRTFVVLAAVLLLAGCGAAASPSPSAPASAPAASDPAASDPAASDPAASDPAASTPAASPAGSGGAGTSVAAELTEYKIALATTNAPAGSVTFELKNAGTIVHEFVVFKTDLAADKLPMLADGTAVDEAGTGLTVVDEVEDIAVSATPSLAVDLPAGHYVALCNVATHYKAGMFSEFSTN
jgi:uncharacterized cupredoxin-like copper-binding protein